MNMKKRKLGNSGLDVAPLALGGNVFGWTVSEEKAFPILDAFVSAGFNLIDTADVYPRWVPGNQGGESEAIIGNWLKRSGKRREVIVATKVGMDMGDGKKSSRKTTSCARPTTRCDGCKLTTSISTNHIRTISRRRSKKRSRLTIS